MACGPTTWVANCLVHWRSKKQAEEGTALKKGALSQQDALSHLHNKLFSSSFFFFFLIVFFSHFSHALVDLLMQSSTPKWTMFFSNYVDVSEKILTLKELFYIFFANNSVFRNKWASWKKHVLFVCSRVRSQCGPCGPLLTLRLTIVTV